MLDVNKSLEFLKLEGYPVAHSFMVESVNELTEVLKRVQFPIVMKIVSQTQTHKTDVGGVITNINSINEAINAFKKLKRITKSIMIQEQLNGVELIIGVKKDPVFNQVIMIGLGGVLVELLKDVSLRVCPINLNEAKLMINKLKTYPLLKGYRGKIGININLLTKLLVNLSRTAVDNDIKELDINPLFATDKKLIIVDARLKL
ncbi:MAG: acetate--CoA ligase family protein [Candidatus Nanoarchaeia archaeon]|jgi:acyl-CoA synthetase (NDP forming)